VLFVLISTQLRAQQTLTLDEALFIHTNATTFVSGETLLYKIYCLKPSDKTPSNVSKIAYIELVDNTKKSIFKNKIILENANGQGDYFIPTTLKTGNYKLVGYTNWMLNKPVSELFQIDITIINPYKAAEKNTTENNVTTAVNPSRNKTESISKENNSTNENVKFKLNKKIFTNRELVDLKIESLNPIAAAGNYSLSVRKLDDLPTKNAPSASAFAIHSSKTLLDLLNLDKPITLPELRGELISGKISAKNNTDRIENISIGFSLPGKSFVFKVVKTNASGNFIFTINKAYYTSESTVQIIDDHAANYNITMDKAPEIEYSKLSFDSNFILSYAIKESLLNRSISSQIENAYYHKKADNISKIATLNPFYFPVAKEYILDDYTRFKTLKETILEVATDIYYKQKDNIFHLHVNDPGVFPQLPESALVLIDGLYLENQNELFTYKMKNIFKIEIIAGRYFVGPKSFNGLISFTTFDNDFKSSQSESSILKTVLLRPLPKKLYNKIDYSNVADNERIPDFRNQLLWNPEVKLNNNTKTSFYTSDISGTFEIRLEGFTPNGSPVSLKETFEVKDSALN
jgi:hypothetical protein